MVLKLDGRFAIVWRDPFSLQFGVDPARVVLREVSPAEERMVAALSSGVSRSGLEMIAASSGATASAVGGLLRKLAPVLRSDGPAQPTPRVSIAGSGETAERIARTLALAGVTVSVGATVRNEEADLGIVLGHYVLDPDNYGFWLRRDLPHLPVVFGDDSVSIGPLVEPGRTACLFCLEHHRRDADPSWSAIASQLWGRTATSETVLVATEVAAISARLVLGRLGLGTVAAGRRAGRTTAARSFRLAVESGELTRRDWMPHPDCGCVALPAGVSEDRPGTGSVRDSDPPTRAAVSAARE